MRPPRFADLFESFVNVIPFQQLSLDAGVAIVGRLIQRFGRHVEYGGRSYYASPSAQATAAARLDRLRACGLSANKAATLRNLARMIGARELREENVVRHDHAPGCKRSDGAAGQRPVERGGGAA